MKQKHHTIHIHKRKSSVFQRLFVFIVILVASSIIVTGIFILMELTKPLQLERESTRQISVTRDRVHWQATPTDLPIPTLIPNKDYTFTSDNIGITFTYNSNHGRYEEHFASSWKGGSVIDGEDMWSAQFFLDSSDTTTHRLYAATLNYVPEDWEAPKMWLSTPLDKTMSAETVKEILQDNSFDPLVVTKVISYTGIAGFEMWSKWCTMDCTVFRTYLIPYNREGYGTIFLYNDVLRIPEAQSGLSLEEQNEIISNTIKNLIDGSGSLETRRVLSHQDAIFNTLQFK